MTSLTFSDLQDAVHGGVAAFRANIRLQPAGGVGSKVFPPTYSGGVYALETRRLINAKGEFENQPAVLLDSVQSQANRLEECLRVAWEEQRLRVPVIYTDFSEADFEGASEQVIESLHEIGRITTFDAPHRIADAIFRDSVNGDGQGFRDAFARAFDANLRNATALFELCPAALVFGTWDSTGSRGGLGNKFPRALVSEIVGINAMPGVRTSSRLDPLAISSKVPIYQRREGAGWTTLLSEAAVNEKGEPIKYESKAGKGNPSAVNHSNVTPDIVKAEKSTEPVSGGVTIDYALQTSVLSLPALRRLRFPVDGEQTGERNHAARTVLAALGLVAITEQFQQGSFLRSRCDLVPELAELTIERVRSATVSEDDKFSLTPEEAIAIYDQAVTRAAEHNLPWQTDEIALAPNPELVGLVVASRQFEFGEREV